MFNKILWPENDFNRIENMIFDSKINITKKIDYQIVKNGIILPNISVDDLPTTGCISDNRGYSVPYAQSRILNPKSEFFYDVNQIRKIEHKKAIFLGIFLNQLGHFILESMSKWWIIDYKEKFSDYELVYTVSAWGEGYWMKEFLELYGIKKAKLILEPTEYDEIIVPNSCSGISPDYYTPEFLKILNKISSKIEPKKCEKLYFSRSKLKDNIIGELEIEKTFKNNGYSIIYPEELSIKDKIAYIKGCSFFAALSGTTPIWMVFSEGNIQEAYVLERFMPMHHNQIMVNQMRNINTYWIDCNCTFLPVGYGPGPCLVGITPYLESFFIEKNYQYMKKDMNKIIEYIPTFLYAWAMNNTSEIIRNCAVKVRDTSCIEDFVTLMKITIADKIVKEKFYKNIIDKKIECVKEDICPISEKEYILSDYKNELILYISYHLILFKLKKIGYRLLKHITFGKKHLKYKQNYKSIKMLLKEAKKYKKHILKDFLHKKM